MRPEHRRYTIPVRLPALHKRILAFLQSHAARGRRGSLQRVRTIPIKKDTSYETIPARNMRRYAFCRGDHRPSRSVAKYYIATSFVFDSRV